MDYLSVDEDLNEFWLLVELGGMELQEFGYFLGSKCLDWLMDFGVPFLVLFKLLSILSRFYCHQEFSGVFFGC